MAHVDLIQPIGLLDLLQCQLSCHFIIINVMNYTLALWSYYTQIKTNNLIQKYQKLDTKKKKKKTLVQKYQYDTIQKYQDVQKYQYVFSSTNLGTKKSAAELWTLYVMKLTGGAGFSFSFLSVRACESHMF